MAYKNLLFLYMLHMFKKNPRQQKVNDLFKSFFSYIVKHSRTSLTRARLMRLNFYANYFQLFRQVV